MTESTSSNSTTGTLAPASTHGKAVVTAWTHAAATIGARRLSPDGGQLVAKVRDVASSRSPIRAATRARADICPCARVASYRAARSSWEDNAARLSEQRKRFLYRRQPLALAFQPCIHGRNQAQELIQLHRVG
jgi:hypothetical protein